MKVQLGSALCACRPRCADQCSIIIPPSVQDDTQVKNLISVLPSASSTYRSPLLKTMRSFASGSARDELVEIPSVREPINTLVMSATGSMSNESQVRTPSKCASSIASRNSFNESRDSGISGLPRPLAKKEPPKDFGKDAEYLIIRRRDSTGVELCNERQASTSSSARDAVAALGSFPKPYQVQFNCNTRLQTYYPLYQGPRITVSSVDGTTVYADDETDTHRNAAAQSLFRALNRQHTDERLKTLDRHLTKIFGAVELDLEIKDMKALNGIDIVGNQWEQESMHVLVEGSNERKIPRWAWRMKDSWKGWSAKIFT